MITAGESVIPRPLLLQILRGLPQLDIAFRAAAVSREWQAVALSSELWRAIDASEGLDVACKIAGTIADPAAVQALDLAGLHPPAADEDEAGGDEDDSEEEEPEGADPSVSLGRAAELFVGLRTLLGKIPNVTQLSIADATADASSLDVLLTSLPKLRSIAARVGAPSLARLASALARVAPQLEELTVEGPLDASFLPGALPSAPRLARLDVDANARGRRRSRVSAHTLVQQAVRLCPALRRLAVRCDAYCAGDWPAVADPQEGARAIDLAGAEGLEALEVRDCFLSDDALAAIAARSLRTARVFSEGLMAPRLEACAALEELTLASGSLTSLAVSGCPALRALHVSGGAQAELRLAVSGCPRLERLVLEGPAAQLALEGLPALREARLERFDAAGLAALPPPLRSLELGEDTDADWGEGGAAPRPALPAAPLAALLARLPRLAALRLYGLRLPEGLAVEHGALELLHVAMCGWGPAARLALACPRLLSLHLTLAPDGAARPPAACALGPAPALREAFFARCPFVTDAWLAGFCREHAALASLALSGCGLEAPQLPCPALTALRLEACPRLRSVALGPPPPAALRSLEVSHAPALRPAAARALLAAAPAASVALLACPGLEGRLRLEAPPGLRRLDLSGCGGVTELELAAAGLEELQCGGMRRLRRVAARGCPRLRRVELAESPRLALVETLP